MLYPTSLSGGGGRFFDNLVVSLDVKKAVVFLEKRCRQQWPIRMQIYAAYNAAPSLNCVNIRCTMHTA